MLELLNHYKTAVKHPISRDLLLTTKAMKNILKNTFVTLLMMCPVLTVCAQKQNEVTLKMGDPAPELQYSKWIKGKPVVTSLDGDQVYVLEFWATWCGPCKKAMPHLTELQRKYKGKVRFIGVNVWENQGEGKEKPYDSYLPKITAFVKGNSANMGYSVVADNNAQYMADHWLKASGQDGIPASFIVKNKQILWIGHPMNLDSVMTTVLAGTYNIQAYKPIYDSLRAQQRKANPLLALKPLMNAIAAKNYPLAIAECDSIKAKWPVMASNLDNVRFVVTLQFMSEKEAISFAKKWEQYDKDAYGAVVAAIIQPDLDTIVSKSTYLWAAKNYEANYTSRYPKYAWYSGLAACYAKAGDFNTAVSDEEKALDESKSALSGGTDKKVTEKTVGQMQSDLEAYKAGKLPGKHKL
jgi:thiol-disulfide isomerase/thioredoxin